MKTPINLGIFQSDLDAAGYKVIGLHTPTAATDAATKAYVDAHAGGGGGGGVSTQNVLYPEDYGALGDGTTDDTTALQDCVDAAVAVNGTVKLSPVTYKITTALSVTGAMAMEGSGMFPLYGTVGITGNESLNVPCVSPYLKGSVILQSGAAQNGITVSVSGLAVNFRDFGIRFAEAIKFSNTGHGIFCEGADYAGKKDSGLTSAWWSNLGVYGHDGNHYAFHFTNGFYNTFDHLTGWGGGGIRLEAKWAICCSGNSTFVNPYFSTCVGGTAHGYHLKADAGNTRIILVTFLRPQSNVVTLTDIGITPAPTSAQNTFRIDPDTGFGVQTPWINLFAPNFETTVSAVTSGVFGTSTVNVTSGLVDGDANSPSVWNSPMTVNSDVRVGGTGMLYIGTDLRLTAITGGGKLQARNTGTGVWADVDQWTNP